MNQSIINPLPVSCDETRKPQLVAAPEGDKEEIQEAA